MPIAMVGTRTRTDYLVTDSKLQNAYMAGVGVGKGASKDDARVPVATAEAGTPSPGSGATMIEKLEGFARF